MGRGRRISAWCAAGLLAVALLFCGAPHASADPSTSPAPSTTATTDPPADQSGSGDGDIKYGTPKNGTIHWEEFGGDTTRAPQDLESFSDLMIGYALTGFGCAAVIGGLLTALLMVVGFRGRSQIAKAALEQSIWIYVGAVIVGSFSTIGGLLFLAAF